MLTIIQILFIFCNLIFSSEVKINLRVIENDTNEVLNFIKNDVRSKRESILLGFNKIDWKTNQKEESYTKYEVLTEDTFSPPPRHSVKFDRELILKDIQKEQLKNHILMPMKKEEKVHDVKSIVSETTHEEEKFSTEVQSEKENDGEYLMWTNFAEKWKKTFGEMITLIVLDKLFMERIYESSRSRSRIPILKRYMVIKCSKGLYYSMVLSISCLENKCVVKMAHRTPNQKYLWINSVDKKLIWTDIENNDALAQYELNDNDEYEKIPFISNAILPEKHIAYFKLFDLIFDRKIIFQSDFSLEDKIYDFHHRDRCCNDNCVIV